MSATADGSIIIDTKIETSGINEGLELLSKNIGKSTGEIGEIGKNAGEAYVKGFKSAFGENLGVSLSEPLKNQTQDITERLNTLSGSMTSFGTNMSSAITEPLKLLGGQMVNSASNMQENLNKVDVAFGNSAENVKKWAETATESFGLSKNQALEAASLFGDMGTSMGLSQKDASNMSTSLAGLAGDLASFKNIDVEQAMTALNGVFTGETESLKTLGVIMTETNLKQFAEEAGLVYNEMSQAEKVQLRYAYVMEMTKNAQGDYARTSDGTANSMRTLSATMDNLIAILGESLLPVIAPIIQFITDLLKKFSELDPSIQQVIVIIGVVLAAIGPVAAAIGGVVSVISTLIPIISTVIGALNPITLVIGAVVAAIVLLIANWDKVKETMKKFDDYLQNIFAVDFTKIFGSTLGEVLNAFFKNVKNIWDSIKRIFNGIVEFITGVFSGDWEKAWNGVKEIFGGIWDMMLAYIKIPINGIIGLINGLVGGVVDGINWIIDALNSLKFDVPEWVPVLGGSKLGFSIPNIPEVRIPYLATGAVIPPNAPFAAVLGDQKNGRNLEAPEDLIRKIVHEEASAGKELIPYLEELIRYSKETAEKDLIIGDRAIARANARGQRAMGYALMSET